MKNIERQEVQGMVISMMLKQIDRYRGIQELKKLGFKTRYSLSGNFYSHLFSDLKKWFNSEYVEPHHWEQGELWGLQHINKKYTRIRREHIMDDDADIWFMNKDSDGKLYGYTQDVDFPSIKEGETYLIDEELERNGMHR